MAYFDNIRDTVTSFWHGLSITLSHMFRRPITIQYPDRIDVPIEDTLPPRYRGFLEVDPSVCTGCLACERACPIGCIAIEMEKDAANPKQRLIARFDIDIGRCMFCGLCVEPCPTGAIQHTREFEGTNQQVANLVFRFVDPLKPQIPYKVVKGEAIPRKVLGEILKAQRKAWNAPAQVSLAEPKPAKKEGESR